MDRLISGLQIHNRGAGTEAGLALIDEIWIHHPGPQPLSDTVTVELRKGLHAVPRLEGVDEVNGILSDAVFLRWNVIERLTFFDQVLVGDRRRGVAVRPVELSDVGEVAVNALGIRTQGVAPPHNERAVVSENRASWIKRNHLNLFLRFRFRKLLFAAVNPCEKTRV